MSSPMKPIVEIVYTYDDMLWMRYRWETRSLHESPHHCIYIVQCPWTEPKNVGVDLQGYLRGARHSPYRHTWVLTIQWIANSWNNWNVSGCDCIISSAQQRQLTSSTNQVFSWPKNFSIPHYENYLKALKNPYFAKPRKFNIDNCLLVLYKYVIIQFEANNIFSEE